MRNSVKLEIITFVLQKILILLDELLSSQLDVLIEEIDFKSFNSVSPDKKIKFFGICGVWFRIYQ